MALIKKREVITKASLNVSIDERVIEQLKAYSAFTNVGTSEIVEESIRAAIKSDQEFSQQGAEASTKKPPTYRKPKENATTA